MKYIDNKATGVKIAYVGGGSRAWAWTFMNDLAKCEDMSGDVYLYDIDFEAAKNNEVIGNAHNTLEETKGIWNYHAVKTPGEAMEGADFVVISILPGTFEEMKSDVDVPEKYGIHQAVGDTTGPGGIIRAMRAIPMFQEIARNVKKYCPEAWVISMTNPMTLCVRALYGEFPEIKAFGCCHEVFGTQELLAAMVREMTGEDAKREDIKVNPVAINHFTWLTDATYRNINLFDMYKEFCETHPEGYFGFVPENWREDCFKAVDKLKMDLFKKYGYIAAAGDRHLSEFCPANWYLSSRERVKEMNFGLTPVSWRTNDLQVRLAKCEKLVSGELKPKLYHSGEEGVEQMRAILGLTELITNINMPNKGQIPNLPIGAVVETNAVFRSGTVQPVLAGEIPKEIYPMVSRIVAEQELVHEGIVERDIEKIFSAFINDPLVTIPVAEARKMFDEMVENTKHYLTDYKL